MANQEHLDVLKQGMRAWNTWRETHTDIPVDLSNTTLKGTYFCNADLNSVNFKETNLTWAVFHKADLRGADLQGAKLTNAYFRDANLGGADLSNTDLQGADFVSADLRGAKLINAKLFRANLVGANLSGADFRKADLTECYIYGISTWDVRLDDAKQINLIITRFNEPTITVDNLEVAQFIYLLLNNERIRHVIDTITSKVVLILGRFTPERMEILNALRSELRKRNYTPVLFDFDKPANRDITETVSTLAHVARFVIADITEARSIPQELQVIVPHLPSVPIQPLLQTSDREYSMFEHFTRYPWVLPLYRYTDQISLLQTLNRDVIDPAEEKVKELAQQ